MDKKKMLLTAFIEGGLVMLLEISSPLIVSPILGNSIDIWAILISLSIGGLAIGYFLGAYLASKEKARKKGVNLLFLFSGLLMFLGWVIIYLQNNSVQSGNDGLLSWLTIIIILFIPLILFGATTPLLIANQKTDEKKEVEMVGRIFSFSTFGGIFFSILTGYFLIPDLGLRDLILVAAFLTFLIPAYSYLKEKKFKMFVFCGFLLVSCVVLTMLNPRLSNSSNVEIIDYSEGINGQLIVADIKNDNNSKNRILFINRMGQTWIDSNGNSLWSYPNFITSVGSLLPRNSKSLVLGLGGGVVARQLDEFNGFDVDAVDIDERIIEIAIRNFDLKESRIDVFHDDARHFVKTSLEMYDFIVLDVFNGEIVPSHSLSVEALKDIDAILSENGLIVINFNGFLKQKEGISGRSLIKTINASGFKAKVFPTIEKSEEERNNLYILYRNEPDWSKITIHVNTAKGQHKISENFVDLKKISLEDAIVITDDLPIMEMLNKKAAQKWRESYLKNFTLRYKKEYKIPLIN